MKTELLPVAQIQARIHFVRGKRVMLDSDLARFYGVATRDLNKAVTRNLDRFPEDFAFQLTREEAQNLMFQVGTSSSQSSSDEKIRNVRRGYGGTRKPARVFTEQGVAMLKGDFAPGDAAVLRKVVPRLGVADVRTFGLSWAECTRLLRLLGFRARDEVVAA